MENFAQDPLAAISTDNVVEIPHASPLPNPFDHAGASPTDSGALSTESGEILHALPYPNPLDRAGASSTDLHSLEKWENAIDGGLVQLEGSCTFSPLDKILIATNNFDDALVVGTGGFGKVYKGFIDDGATTTIVAMKRLNAESKQGAEEFWTEVKLLSKLRHTHLVSLIGYCKEYQEMILVYEYIVCGTLANRLYKTSREESDKSISHLTWEQRLNICLGAARGLDYLHNGTEQGIIHRDVKSTNILLDENLVAKVSDFGLSKSITSHTITHVSTNVKGTIGYLDPDYFYIKRLTKKSDVYAFGVVLLEVLCGRAPVDTRLEEGQISLILWAQMYIKRGKLDQIIDPSLNGKTTPRSLKYFAELANKCLHTQPNERPTISKVVETLEIALASHERNRRSQGTIAMVFPGIKVVPKGVSPRWRDREDWFLKELSDELTQSGCRRFSFKWICAATNNFDEYLLIEENYIGFRLYKGCMVGEIVEVTIKRCDFKRDFFKMKKKILAEIRVQSLTHPNIDSLIGFCYEKDELILVCKFMVNGTLTSHLWGDNDPLPWKKRLEICIDVAHGLDYLHTNVKQKAIHRNINPSNILLDDKWVAKVANFEVYEPIPTGIEVYEKYVRYGKVKTKSDVYSFGVVLFEVLCAKKHYTDKDTLISWLIECIKRGTIDKVIDPFLIGKIAPGCFRYFVTTALSCVVKESIRRPYMDTVLGRLQSSLQLQEAWENCIEMGDELPMADVPSSYSISVNSEVTIGEQRFLISNLVRWATSFSEPSFSRSRYRRAVASTFEKFARHALDSWSFDDVPSGESISHNNRDYTPEFITDQIFQSRGDMLDWVQIVGLQNGIVVVINKSANLKGGKMPKCILSCERGGKYKPPKHGVEGHRNTGTKKCECPFELRGIPMPPDGVMWGLKVSCGIHNHEVAEDIEGHEYPSRLKPTEKQFVFDMANRAAPREILSMLKEQNPSNSTGIKSIYNAIFQKNKATQGDLTSTQYVLQQLINKRYLHAFNQNPKTKEITDIVWVHPTSLELSVNFPSVLVIDATYKTNEYRIPLLEVVGITSTMQTYSLMFAYLSNEKVERLTWALDTLKRWMVGNGASLPSVFVTDRDLTLLNAIEVCFPQARHILCVWHINQCVMKHCKPTLGNAWDSFYHAWHSLINSSTQSSFQQKWVAMCEDYQRYPRVLKYVFETWLRSYKERFVSAWTDTCMHLGSNSSQRAESAHARLKKYLGDTMSDLQTSFHKIEKMLDHQFGDIKKSFQKALNIPRHKHLHDDFFCEVRCRISLEAMKCIDIQLKSAKEASPYLTGFCNCKIKITHGLPCMHDLAYYLSLPMPIPLGSVHSHWCRLSMHSHRFSDEGTQPDRTPKVVDMLSKMDPCAREQMIDKIIDMADPSRSTVQPPAYNMEHKGRLAGRDEQSGRRFSYSGPSTSESMVGSTAQRREKRGKGFGVRNTQPTHAQELDVVIDNPFIHHFPMAYRGYIADIVDVQGDGHCGFRAIAALIGYGADHWARVRLELIDEITNNIDLYKAVFPEWGCAQQQIEVLTYFDSIAPPEHWMDSMTMGVVIASKYNLVLHTFDASPTSCFTHLPLRSPPVPVRERREIAIALIGGNHFVQVFLRRHCPVPPIPLWCWEHALDEAKGWAPIYETRVDLWYQVMFPEQDPRRAQFGGNID